jgi:hypothetical protein
MKNATSIFGKVFNEMMEFKSEGIFQLVKEQKIDITVAITVLSEMAMASPTFNFFFI